MMKRLNSASVMERLDIKSRETLRQLVKRRLLPVPMKDDGGGQNYWLEQDIDNYIKAQAKRRAKS